MVRHNRGFRSLKAAKSKELPIEALIARLPAPHLGIGKEETLVGGTSVEHIRLLALEVELESVIGDGETGHIGDALAQGQPAVDVLSR